MRSLIFLSMLALLVSCKKEGSETTEQLVSNSSWIITERTVKTGSQDPVNDFEDWKPCAKDDEYLFKSDHSYIHTQGATACPGESQVLMTGSWQLSSDEKSIYYTIGGNTSQYVIAELTGNTMTLRANEGMVETVTKYKH